MRAVCCLCGLAAFCFPLVGQRAEAAAYNSVTITSGWNESPGGLLVGGYADGKWSSPLDKPMTLNGKPFNSEGGDCPDDSEGKEFPATSEMMPKGAKIVYYTAAGKRLGLFEVEALSLVCPGMRHGYLLGPDKGALKRDVAEDMPDGLVIALPEGSKNTFVPTKREEKGKGLLFSAVFGGKPVTLTFAPKKDKDGGETIQGTLIYNGKKIPFEEPPTGDVSTINGTFIDLNSDGVLEFVWFVDGPGGGGYSIFSITGDKVTDVLAGSGE